ncbi:hypothetical protein [Kitasatospora sp. NPDC057015]|uniref:hypothetical protein n=1 Tax=Kitasatospora sp. NPDC057015 TaxID=3346001 RepID=UPI003636F86C
MRTSAETADESPDSTVGGPARASQDTGAPRRDVVDRLRTAALLSATRSWFWPALLVVGYLLQVAYRLYFVRHLSYPSVHADEDSYLVLARVLAGRPTTEMPVGVVIPGGYPLLISPALRIADNPVTAYHLVMGINALLNALVFPLAYVALRRFGLRRVLALLFGAATALLPPVVFYSQFAMSDTVMPVLVLGWLLCMHGWLSEGTARRRTWSAVGTGASAAYMMATHDRGSVVIAITVLVLVLALLLRWAPRRASLAGLATALAGAAAVKLFSAWLNTLFTVPPSEVGNLALEGITNTEILGRTLTRTAGQIWYLIVSTWGLGGLTIVFALFAVFSGRVPRALRVLSGVVVALMCGTALAAAAALPDDGRIDNWVYARYLSYLVPTLFVAAIALLARLSRRRLVYLVAGTALLALVLGEVVMQYAGKLLHDQVFVPWALADTSFLTLNWQSLEMVRATVAAMVVLAVVVLMRAAGGLRVLWGIGLSLVLFGAFATATVTDHVTYPHSKVRKASATGFTKAAGIVRGDSVVLAWDLDWGLRMAQAYEVYNGRIWVRDPRWQEVPAQATVVVTPLEPGRSPEALWDNHPAEWYVAAVSEKEHWVVWRRR